MPEPKYLTTEELTRLFRAITNVRDTAIFRVAYHRGLRPSEVGLLQMSDYQQSQGRLYVHRLKRGRSGEFILTDVESKALRAWVKERGKAAGPLFTSSRGSAISRQMLDVLMRQYGATADLPEDRRHFHCLRHSCGTSLMDRGADVADVQDHLGHKSIQNTMIYAQITNKRRSDAGKGLRNWT